LIIDRLVPQEGAKFCYSADAEVCLSRIQNKLAVTLVYFQIIQSRTASYIYSVIFHSFIHPLPFISSFIS